MVSKDLISRNLPRCIDGKLRKETGEAWNKADTNTHIRTAPPHLSSQGPFARESSTGGLVQSTVLVQVQPLGDPRPPGTRLVLYTQFFSYYQPVLFAPVCSPYQTMKMKTRRGGGWWCQAVWGGGCCCSLPQGGRFHHPGTLRTQEGTRKPI